MRNRNWCFTTFNLWSDDKYKALAAKPDINYICRGVETCPDTGRVHHQGYVEFTSAKRIGQVKTLLEDNAVHLEPRRGKQQQAIDYCKKDGVFTDWGKPKAQGKSKEVEDAMEAVREGVKLNDILSGLSGHAFHTYRRSISDFVRFNAAIKFNEDYDVNVGRTVRVYWGPTGTGKTRRVHDESPDVAMVEWDGRFLLGYNGEREVCFDDFDWTTMPRSTFLKMTDRYKCVMPIKGGETVWAVTKIYFTSNFDPANWYNGCGAIAARFARNGDSIVEHMQ